MIGAKPYEFRGRSYLAYINHPQPGERIVIHAGARPVKREEVQDLRMRLSNDDDTTGLVRKLALPLLNRVFMSNKCRLLTLGAGLGTAIIGEPCNAGTIFRRKPSPDLVGLYTSDELDELDGKIPQDSDRGEFNWAWPLSDIEAFDSPIPARGMQGFWNWPISSAATARP